VRKLRGVVEWLGKREVFEDTGLGGGAVSELGRLQRERTDEIGWRATGRRLLVLSHRSWMGRNVRCDNKGYFLKYFKFYVIYYCVSGSYDQP
jgi:hypothetical protein